ncbi:MAG TPA: hypothetical protein VII01_13150 [Solirubrobacteraceae bacterium]
MSDNKTDRRSAHDVRQDDERITRAAKRADWAHSALEGAADDLDDAHGEEGKPLTDLADVVQEEAVRVSNLADDIDSHRRPPDRPDEESH